MNMNNYRVGVIEDSTVLQEMLCESLDEIDVEVAFTATGQSNALHSLEDQNVDLLIIDLELDEGSGLGVIEAVSDSPSRYGKPLKVVYSNYAVSSMSRRAKELGVDEIFDKSFQFDDLLDFISQKKSEK